MIDFSDPKFGVWEYSPYQLSIGVNAASRTTKKFHIIAPHAQFSMVHLGAICDTTVAFVWSISIVRNNQRFMIKQEASFTGTQLYPLREDHFLGQGDFLEFTLANAAGTELILINVLGFLRVCDCKLPSQLKPC